MWLLIVCFLEDAINALAYFCVAAYVASQKPVAWVPWFFLIAFVWLHLAVCAWEIYGTTARVTTAVLSNWRPLWIAYTGQCTGCQAYSCKDIVWYDDYSIDNGTKADETYVEPREGYSVWLLLNWSGSYWRRFHWKWQVEVGQGKEFYTHSTQMAKYWQTFPGLLAKQRELLRPSKHGSMSL